MVVDLKLLYLVGNLAMVEFCGLFLNITPHLLDGIG